MGKKGADLFSALVQEFLRSPDCQRVVLPAGQRLLPGIAVPEVSAPVSSVIQPKDPLQSIIDHPTGGRVSPV